MVAALSILLSVLCCIAVVVLASRLLGRTWLFSPPVLMVAYFLLVNLPGILLVDSRTALDRALVAHAMWLFGILLGSLIFVQSRRAYVGRSIILPPTYFTGNKSACLIFIFIGVISVIFTFMMFGRAPLLIAIDALLSGDTDMTMHKARQLNTLEHRYGDTIYFGQGYLRQIYTVVSPIFCVALFLFYRLRLRQAPPLFLKFLMAFFVFASGLNGQIWVAAYTIILFMMTKFFADSVTVQRFNSMRLIVRGLVGYFALLGFVFSYRYLQHLQGRHFDDFYGDTLRRIYSYTVAPLFEIFPNSQPYRFGTTWFNDLAGMLPGSSQSFAYEVHYLVHGGGWGFTLSPGIVASSYVNFGYIGVVFVGLSLTALFTAVFSRLVQSRSVLNIAVGIYLSFAFMSGLPGDLVSYAVALTTAAAIIFAYKLTCIVTHRPHQVPALYR